MAAFTSLKNTFLLPELCYAGVETILNNLLAYQEESTLFLQRTAGKTLKIELQNTNIVCYWLFSTQRIDMLRHYEGETDCHIILTPSVLFSPPKQSELTTLLQNRQVVLYGDLSFLKDIVGFLEKANIDSAELITPYTGDVIAQSAVNFCTFFTKSLKSHLLQSRQFWGERLTEEWKICPPSPAVSDFCTQVEILSTNVARLEQRIQALKEVIRPDENS